MLFIYIMSHLIVVLDEVDLTENENERTCSNSNNPAVWIEGLCLTMSDKRSLESANGWLSGNIINAGQQLLKKKFPGIAGLQSVVLGKTLAFDVCPNAFVQVLHERDNHWITVSTKGMHG